MHLPFLTVPQISSVTTWCSKSSDHATVSNMQELRVLNAPSVVYKCSWITMMSSNLLASGANFSFGFWTQKEYDKKCAARNSCTDKVEGTRVFSWRRNKSPMQNFSECFCHIVPNMAQNIWVDMLIYRISLYDKISIHNSIYVRKQSECSSHFTQTCLAYLKYRDEGLFQWKDGCKQCDNHERGRVPITAVPQVQTQSNMTLVLIIQHWMSRSCNTAL